ncbi:mucin-binding protein [Secundilactobacillus muriivasis]
MSKRAVRGRAKLIKDTAQTKVWYKMYKNGKNWIVAGIATTALGLAVSTVPAKAATSDTADPVVSAPVPSTTSGTGDEQTATLTTPAADATAVPQQPVADSTPQQATAESAQTTTSPEISADSTYQPVDSAPAAPATSTDASSTDTTKAASDSASTTATTPTSGSGAGAIATQSQSESTAPDQTPTIKQETSGNVTSTDNSSTTTAASASAATQQSIAAAAPSTAATKAVSAAVPAAPLVMSSVIIPATQVTAVNPGSVTMTNTALQEAIAIYKDKTNASTTAAGLTQVGGTGTNAFYTSPTVAIEFSGTPFSGNIATYPNALSTEVINGQIWVKNVSISATNTRTVNGKVELTPASVITVTVPTQNLAMTGASSTFQQASGGVPSLFIESDAPGASPSVTELTTIGTGFPKSISINATTKTATVGNADTITVSTSQYYTTGTSPTAVSASNRVYDGVFTIENIQLKPTVTWNPFSSTGLAASGTGTAVGDTITIKSDDGKKSVTATVGSNWTWNADLAAAGFTATDGIYVVESNNIGDIPGAAAALQYGQDTRTIVYMDALTGAEIKSSQPTSMIVQAGGTPSGVSANSATITRGTYTQANGAAAVFPAIAKENLEQIDGYLPATSGLTTIPGLLNGNVKQYVQLYPAVYTVDPDTVEDPNKPSTNVSPKDPNTPVKPGDPNSPVFPPGVADNNLETIVPEILHYQDGETGETVASDYTTSLDFKRAASVDFSKTDSQGNPQVTYTDWRPVTTDTFAEVTNPVVRGYVTSKPVYSEVPVDVTQENPAYEDTVNYYPAEVIVGPKEPVEPTDPTGPKDQGDTVTDKPDDPRVYPNGVTKDDLNRSVDRTIHYVSALTGETLAPDEVTPAEYSRVALIRFDQLDENGNATVYYQDWKGPTAYPDATSPTVTGYFTKTPVVEGVPVTVNSAPSEVTVVYYPNEIVVGPKEPDPDKPIDSSNPTGPKDEGDKIVPGDDNSPEYPAGVTAEDLNGQRTQTIHYVDKATGEKVAEDNTAIIEYTRTGLVDVQKGTVSYTDWTPAPGTFAAVASPVVEGKITFGPEVAAMDVAYTDTDKDITVFYYPAEIVVGPHDPDPNKPIDETNPTGPKDEGTTIVPGDEDGPKYPGGLTADDLNTKVTQTINYVDAVTGDPIAQTNNAELAFTRTGTLNVATGTVTYADWQPVTTDEFAAVTSPTVAGYYPNVSVVPAVKVTNETAPIVEVVKYYPAEIIVGPKDPDPNKPIDPSNPTGPKDEGTDVVPGDEDGPKYPGGLTADDLNVTKTQTIHYVDKLTGETVAKDNVATQAFERNGIVAVQTGQVTYTDWTPATANYPAVVNPTVAGKITLKPQVDAQAVTATDENTDMTVFYYPAEVIVGPHDPDPDKPIDPSNPTGPKDPGTSIVPGDEDGPKYPEGVTADKLNAKITQTVHYLDAATGDPVATDATAELAFTRTGTVNVATGEVTYSPWVATTTDQFGEVVSPDVDGMFTLVKAIPAVTVTGDSQPIVETVKYYPKEIIVGPNEPDPNKPIDETNPTGPKDPGTSIVPGDEDSPKYPGGVTVDDLKTSVTQTVHYIDAATGQPIAKDATAELAFTRTGTVDVQNGTVSYADWKAVTTDVFGEVVSPTVDGYYPLVTSIPATTVKGDSQPIVETVKYYPDQVIVGPKDPDPTKPIDPSNPTGPKNPGDEIIPGDEDTPTYPAGVTATDLNMTKTQTIHYIDKLTGETVANDHIATQAFERNGIVAVQTGQVTYTAWTPATANYPAVINPTVDGKITLKPQVDAQAVTATDENTDMTVFYYPAEVIVGPHDPDPDKPIDPSNPTGPKDPGTSIVPGDEDGPKYPEGVTEKDLNTIVTQTIHYVNAGTGETVAPDSAATLAFTRTGTVNVATGTVTYSPWVPVTTDQFAAVTSPSVAGLYPIVTTVDAVTVTGDTAPIVTTVKYYPAEIIVGPKDPDPNKPIDPSNPTGPKDPGTSIVPGDEDSPKYPGGLTQSDLNQIISRTINYLNPDGTKAADSVIQLVHYERQATLNVATGAVTYGDWTVVDSNVFPAVLSPTIQGYTPDLAIVAQLAVTPTDANTIVNVHYTAVPGTSTPETSTPGTGIETPTPGGGNGSGGNETPGGTTPVVDTPIVDTGGTTGGGASAGTGDNGGNTKTGGSGGQVTATPTTPGTVKTPAATGTVTVGQSPTSNEQATLPQTDDANQATSLIGLLLMSALGLTGWKKRKKTDSK